MVDAVRIDLMSPFIILDDAGGDGRHPAKLFTSPLEIVTASARSAVPDALQKLREFVAAGKHVAGYLSYDASHALEPRLETITERTGDGPLLWFGVFDDVQSVPGEDLFSIFANRESRVEAPVPRISEAEHAAALARCKALIAAGDIYQVNLTFEADIRFTGHPLALYARLRQTQRMNYGAVIWTGHRWILSASPELFFRLSGGKLEAKPMKGTAPRHPQPEADAAVATMLGLDPKNRAENLMITDLLRNDLSRVALPGSVQVPEAFNVETYPTVHQMISRVTAELRPGLDAFDVIKTIYPCGSITGAPKIRAMEVIDAIETRSRGVYTGSIGWVAPDGEAIFNVAIRTLVGTDEHATIGVGSGIVYDSETNSEWTECLDKMAFVTHSARPFHLIETMVTRSHEGIALLDFHMARLAQSARYHGFQYDTHDMLNLLQAVIGGLREDARVKLTLARDGNVAIATMPMPQTPPGPIDVHIMPLPVSDDDVRLFHKTSDRAFYDDARRASGAFEVIFERPDGFLTEGSISNLFVERDGMLLTPPDTDGLLPGVLRASLLANGRAEQKRLRANDLKDGFYLGNAVRGLFQCQLVAGA